jgi:hypothetical protein
MNSLWDIRIFLGLVPKESPCISVYMLMADPVGRAVSGVGLRPLACWDCGFESRWGTDVRRLCVVYCQVKVSATDWSLVQRSPAELDVSQCDREATTVRSLWPFNGYIGMERMHVNDFLKLILDLSTFFYLPTDTQLNCLKNNFKIYTKIGITTFPTCFGVIAIIRERNIRSC